MRYVLVPQLRPNPVEADALAFASLRTCKEMDHYERRGKPMGEQTVVVSGLRSAPRGYWVCYVTPDRAMTRPWFKHE